MKKMKSKLIELFKEGWCSGQIVRIAKKMNKPSSTTHYNSEEFRKRGSNKDIRCCF